MCFISNGILDELKKEFRYARLGDNLGLSKKEVRYVAEGTEGGIVQ